MKYIGTVVTTIGVMPESVVMGVHLCLVAGYSCNGIIYLPLQ